MAQAKRLIPDLAARTADLAKPGWGTVFLLPPVSIGTEEVQHAAIGSVPKGFSIGGLSPVLTFRDNLLIYGAATPAGYRCGDVNLDQQPTIGQTRLLPGYSWHDLQENWQSGLRAENITEDARLLALGLSLLFVCRHHLARHGPS